MLVWTEMHFKYGKMRHQYNGIGPVPPTRTHTGKNAPLPKTDTSCDITDRNLF